MKSYELVKLKMLELGFTRNQFATQVLGYKNINKGLRKVDGILSDGQILIEDVQKIAKGLSITEQELLDSMIETEQESQNNEEKLRKEERDLERIKFVPYLYCINEYRRPQPIFVAALTQGLRYIYYPKEFTTDYTLEEQLKQVKFDVVEHYIKNEGHIVAFGKILYYIYRYDFDLTFSELVLFDINGEIITEKEGLRLNEGRVGLYIKNSKTHIEQLFEAKKNIIDRRN